MVICWRAPARKHAGGRWSKILGVDTSDSQAALAFLVDVLDGSTAPGVPRAIPDSDVLIQMARREDVLGLLHARLNAPDTATRMPEALREAVAAASNTEVIRSLYQESHARRIIARLLEARLPVLFLKGSALGWWAYPAPWQRSCSDIDLLLPSRADVDRAALALAEMGYRPAKVALPGEWVSFELTLAHGVEGSHRLEVDLHWQLSSSPMFAFRFNWQELESCAIELPRLAIGARGLKPVHAWVHACMHRLQNRSNGVSDTLKWLVDLDLLARGFNEIDWQELTQLVCDRGLAGTCLDGAHAAAVHFGVVMPANIQAQLEAVAKAETMDVQRLEDWWYVQRMCLAAFPSMRMKLRWLRERLIPNRAHLEARYGKDTRFLASMSQRLRAALRR